MLSFRLKALSSCWLCTWNNLLFVKESCTVLFFTVMKAGKRYTPILNRFWPFLKTLRVRFKRWVRSWILRYCAACGWESYWTLSSAATKRVQGPSVSVAERRIQNWPRWKPHFGLQIWIKSHGPGTRRPIGADLAKWHHSTISDGWASDQRRLTSALL